LPPYFVWFDWKYLLCLELTDPGFDASVLSEFRSRLLSGSAEEKILEKLLGHFQAQGLLKGRGQQRTGSTHVVGAIRSLNRLELIGETMRHALNSLAVLAPEWLLAHSQPGWLDRYGTRVQEYRLPTSISQRDAYAQQVGADGLSLLQAVDDPSAPVWVREVPAVQILRRVWWQQYTWRDAAQLRWRQTEELPPATLCIKTPYDPEVRYGHKRSTHWVGYKVHLTETCDPDSPRLITHVETTLAPVIDGNVTDTIHQALQTKHLLPQDHLVDCGYVEAGLLVTSQQAYGVNLVGPTRHDTGWQTREGQGFGLSAFQIDWVQQKATCPAGKTSHLWYPTTDIHQRSVIQIKFAKGDCRACLLQTQCTRATPPRRTLTVLPEAQQLALQAARDRETTQAFKDQYAQRAGIEGTISQGVRAFDLRQARYIGLARTHLQHILTAASMNLVRAMRWLMGEPLAQTRQSAFVRLYPPAPA
jgi:transposase